MARSSFAQPRGALSNRKWNYSFGLWPGTYAFDQSANATPITLGFDVGEERTTNSLDKRLGQRVRARRLEIGMSQEVLAKRLGVTFQQVQKYERGVNRIAASRLWDVSEALEVPVAQFFDGLPGGSKKAVDDQRRLEQALATPGVIDLVLMFASIKTGKIRRQVLELVRTMSGD